MSETGPPVDRMTHSCENSTFRFAGGKNERFCAVERLKNKEGSSFFANNKSYSKQDICDGDILPAH